jgi:hypothetical protein
MLSKLRFYWSLILFTLQLIDKLVQLERYSGSKLSEKVFKNLALYNID